MDVSTTLTGMLLKAFRILNASPHLSNIDVLLYTGGSAYAVIGIIDTLKYLKPDVSTICVGQTASSASLLLVKALFSDMPTENVDSHLSTPQVAESEFWMLEKFSFH